MKDKPPIWFGGIAWKEAEQPFYALPEIQKIFNLGINLSDYGLGIQSINFVPIAVQPAHEIHEEEVHYRRKKHELELKLKLDYEKVKQADPEQFLRMVGQLFLDSIDDYPKHNIPDFDWKQFKKDVAKVLEENGLLETIT